MIFTVEVFWDNGTNKRVGTTSFQQIILLLAALTSEEDPPKRISIKISK